MGNYERTLCWDCRNSTEKGCEWAERFEPVEGWEAEESFKKEYGKTYIVRKCPKFIRDAYHFGEYRNKEDYRKYLKGVEKRRREQEERERRQNEQTYHHRQFDR